MDMMDNFVAYVYEAAYIALESGYFEGNCCLGSHALTAMERILKAFVIDGREQCESYILENESLSNRQRAKLLYNKCSESEKKEFFSQLTYDELILYHSANFDISREYGNYLGEKFSMDNMRIADIGGSSGGLLTGIADRCKNIFSAVFDTEAACETGRSINDNIEFIPCDFFSPDFGGREFDVVILSNILHDWEDEKVILLLNNIKPILENCKYLIIHEDILDNSGLAPVETLVYGLRLAINVSGGFQRTFSQLDLLADGIGCGVKGYKRLNFAPLSACIYNK